MTTRKTKKEWVLFSWLSPFSPIVSEANDTHEQNLIHVDIPGLPLGATEDDYRDIPEDPVDDDAVVLDATGKIFCILQFFFVWSYKNFIDPLEGDFFEGDISGVKLTTQESSSPSSTSEEGDSVIIKNAVKNTYQLWPGKEIPYVISNSFRGSERSVIREAMEQFAR